MEYLSSHRWNFSDCPDLLVGFFILQKKSKILYKKC
nr:MAG TPA: hypothetical protein [Caudoviricetes sp.]